MSWLSKFTTPLWRMFKGGRTDVQTIATLLVGTLSSAQKAEFKQILNAGQVTANIAALAEPNSTDVKIFQEWVDGALQIIQ